MKRKVFAFILAMLTFFTLGACEDLGTQVDLPGGYDINVISDVESFDYSIDTDAEGTITFELGDYDDSAYQFSHWENSNGEVLSEKASFVFDFEEGDYTVEAIFDQVESSDNDTEDDTNNDTNDDQDTTGDEDRMEEDSTNDEDPIITEVYSTGFETTEVGFWSDYGTYDFDGVDWIQNHTANSVYANQDRYKGDASIRIDNEEDSFIYTLDAFSEVNSFSFVAANTHMDSNGALSVSISKDASTWTELGLETLTDTLETYEYTLVFDELEGFSYDDAIHMRIEGTSGRINVDDFKVFGGSEAITTPDDSTDESGDGSAAVIDVDGEFIDKDNVALYLHTYDELPDNYMAYDEFASNGWEESELRSETDNDLMSLGQKDFHNYEGLLPENKTYHSADINFDGSDSRGVERLVYSNDGLIYYTGDHYESFELLYGDSDGSEDSTGDDTTDSGTGDNTTPQDPDLEGNLANLLDEELISYYIDAEGLYGNELKNTLETLLNTDVDPVSYGDARYILDESDRDPDNSNNLVQVYTRDSVNGGWNTNPLIWNREHVWPSSIGGPDDDIHHLKPSDPNENSSRSNLPFGESGSTYEPHDDVKGDIARIVFYMDARYSNLSIDDSIGDLGTLLQWHVNDPVDDFERNRNDVLYSYQNNRNPFIDHPHLALLMFNDHASVNLD